MLSPALPALNDKEDPKIPSGLPFVIDAHVHVFPEPIFKAVWDWFDAHAWPIRYRLTAEAVVNYLLVRGVGHVVAFQYAHRPGISSGLNRFMAALCDRFSGKVTGMATVFPGEDQVRTLLKDAFGMGLKGVKLHSHVQCFDMNAKEMDPIYRICSEENKPLVMHVSREPKSPAYRCDPHLLCDAGKLERVIARYPDLNVCVPHLGVDEFGLYRRLIEKYDNLWLDTAMVLTDYFPMTNRCRLKDMRTDRIMYGTDFPNIPYAWDREIKCLGKEGLSGDSLERILATNAIRFFHLEPPDLP